MVASVSQDCRKSVPHSAWPKTAETYSHGSGAPKSDVRVSMRPPTLSEGGPRGEDPSISLSAGFPWLPGPLGAPGLAHTALPPLPSLLSLSSQQPCGSGAHPTPV